MIYNIEEFVEIIIQFHLLAKPVFIGTGKIRITVQIQLL